MKYNTSVGPIEVHSANEQTLPLIYNDSFLELSQTRILNAKLAVVTMAEKGSGILVFDHIDASQVVSTSIDVNGIKYERNDNLHSHDYFEIAFITEGELDIQIETRTSRYKSGDAILFNCNTRHAEAKLIQAKVTYLCISRDYLLHWPDEDNQLLKMKIPIMDFLHNNLNDEVHRNKNYMAFKYIGADERASSAMTSLEDIIHEMKGQRPGHMMMLRALVFRILCQLNDHSQFLVSFVDLGTDREINLANDTKRLLQKVKHHIKRGELAQILNYNGDYLNRIFKKHFGCSIKEYNQKIYMDEAEKLLKRTGLSVQDISKLLGFENKTHFYALFDKFYGTTPSVYRQKYLAHHVDETH